jgi:hypothetical protein
MSGQGHERTFHTLIRHVRFSAGTRPRVDRLVFVPVVLVPLATAGVPSFAYDVRDFGRVARHWRLGVAWSRMSALVISGHWSAN